MRFLLFFVFAAAMHALTDKRILLGVTGSIAAYKSAELVRRLREAGAVVRVAMTAAATEFVRPLTFQALSGNPVHLALLDPAAEAGMGHIELARWADAVLVAPASADFMARLAHGLADDLLATLCLATRAPLLLAPAMNRSMWQHAATQDNRRVLERRGVRLLGPEEGGQACGESGPGRMIEPAPLVDALAALFRPGRLQGLTVLVTAGPTREAIDPVRYVGNRSSGRMGYAVAAAAAEAGARVVLVSGPGALEAPAGVECIRVESAQEMHDAVLGRAAEADIFVAAAAVADYRPAAPAAHKIKKGAQTLTLALERTPDILAAVAGLTRPPFTVGFAAETERLEEHALAKLSGKALDMIAANRVGEAGSGFEAEENALQVYWTGGARALARAPKPRLARELIALVAERYHEKNTA
jgi:phosphopantothenoylcysteine decarboxylase / phosphopantothenate---cysteine ligase